MTQTVCLEPLTLPRQRWSALATPHLDRGRLTIGETREMLIGSYIHIQSVKTNTLQQQRTEVTGTTQTPTHAQETSINTQIINAIMGHCAAKQNEIPFWIDRKDCQLEDVHPYSTPQDK